MCHFRKMNINSFRIFELYSLPEIIFGMYIFSSIFEERKLCGYYMYSLQE